MMFSKCNAGNPDTLKFCGECGTKLDLSDEAQVSFTKILETPLESFTRSILFPNRYESIEELGTGGMGYTKILITGEEG